VPMNMIPADQARLSEPKTVEPLAEDDKEDDDERGSPPTETRARQERQALARSRTARSHEKIFADATTRILRREKDKVLAEAKKQLGTRDSALFFEWLDDFYRDDMPGYIKRQIGAPAEALATAIKILAEQEVNAEDTDVTKAVDDYSIAFAARYSSSSRGQIKKIIKDAAVNETDALADLEARLDEWEDGRPGQVALHESVQLSNFIAKVVFVAAGISLLRWVNMGSKTCEFCSQLDGKIMGIEQPFLSADQEIVGRGGAMTVSGPKTQPPLHAGCVCAIVAEG